MQVEFGATPVLPTPDNYSDVQYEYTFAGWDREVETVRGNITYVAKFSKSLRQYVVTWDVDGQQTEVGYDYGAMPSYDGIPTKQSNIQFSYSFEGWDKEIANVAGDVTYTAQFAEHVNQYTISFVVDGVTHTEQFAYGSMPEFSGNTAKADDEIYRYVFAGWDKELTEVCGDETYTAQYEANLIGRATAINSAFTVENDGSFTTVISLCDIQNMTSAVMVLYYDITLVTIEGYQCRDGVTVIDVDDGYISMRVDGLGDRESCELLEITFVIGVALNESETEFIGMVSDEMITYAFSKLSKEQYDGGATDVRGDLDLDGDVDAQDLTILARHVAGIEQVTGQALSNADVDNDGDIDANDLTMHARYVAGIITDWEQE